MWTSVETPILKAFVFFSVYEYLFHQFILKSCCMESSDATRKVVRRKAWRKRWYLMVRCIIQLFLLWLYASAGGLASFLRCHYCASPLPNTHTSGLVKCLVHKPTRSWTRTGTKVLHRLEAPALPTLSSEPLGIELPFLTVVLEASIWETKKESKDKMNDSNVWSLKSD